GGHREPRCAAGRHLGADATPGARLPFRQDVVVRPRHHQLRPARDALAAMVAALRTGRVVVDVAHGIEVARTAVGATLDRAVRRQYALDRPRTVLTKEARAHAGVEMVPGQRLAERATAEIELRVEPAGGERLAPELGTAAIRPAVEARACALRVLEHVRQAAVATGEDAFEPRQPAVVPAELDAAPPELAPQQRLPCLGLVDVELRGPLERCVWLRRERGHA